MNTMRASITSAVLSSPLPGPRRVVLRTLTLMLLASSTFACRSVDGEDAVAPGLPPDALVDRVELSRWADDVFGAMLEERRFSALAVAITQGQEVLLERGYGHADWQEGTPVDPHRSQFRIGSLTKPFFAVAIAQLLERGRIASLDDPVNEYLQRFKVEHPFNDDITIWDMLTHQGGLGTYAVRVEDPGAPRPEPLLSGEYIVAHLPPVVREPGTMSIYCNPCSAVLGFMVEDITGETLEAYLSENVYRPLGMTNTTLTNEPDPGLDMVTEFSFLADGTPVPVTYPAITPFISYAGDMNSTAGDMAKWLIAHATRGRGHAAKILEAETFDLLHSRRRGNHPNASGFGMQWFNYEYNGHTVLEHYGSISFRSLELIVPAMELGVFVTVAGGGEPGSGWGGGADAPPRPPSLHPEVLPQLSHSGLRALLLERFLGPLEIPEGIDADPADYVGLYRQIPAARESAAAGAGRLVRVHPEGGLEIGGLGPYRPVGHDAFVLDGQLPLEAGFGVSNRYVFLRTDSGNMRMFAHVNAGGFERSEE